MSVTFALSLVAILCGVEAGDLDLHVTLPTCPRGHWASSIIFTQDICLKDESPPPEDSRGRHRNKGDVKGQGVKGDDPKEVVDWYDTESLQDFPDIEIEPRRDAAFAQERGEDWLSLQGQEDRADLIAQQARQRSLEYCNPIEEGKATEEGAVSEDYELHSVHIMLRHGDRSPFYKMPNQESPSLSCTVNISEAGPYRDLTTAYLNFAKQHGHKIAHGKRLGLFPKTPTCMGAQLTGKGLIQHLNNGDLLRKIYIEQLGLFPSVEPELRDIYFRTTDYTRTYQSGLAFLYGLMPKFDFTKLDVNIAPQLSFCSQELSGVPCSCPTVNKLFEAARKEEKVLASTPDAAALLLQIKEQLAGVFGVDSSRIPWVGAIIEVLMGYVCHDLPLPCHSGEPGSEHKNCITWPMVHQMWKYLDLHGSLTLAGHAEQKYNRLAMHPLLREIALRMLNSTQSQSSHHTRLVVYSGHDKTVTPLTRALGINDGRWPPYGSRLVFELYSTNSNAQYFLRVLFNGKDRTGKLRFCPENALVNGLCPLDSFVHYVLEQDMKFFGKSNYVDACAL